MVSARQKTEPYLKKISEELAENMTVVRIDTDQNPELYKALDVSALPVLKYKNSGMVWQYNGFIDEEGVRTQLETHGNG